MPNPNQSIANKIKDLRKQKNITQAKMADALSLTVAAYCRIENNQTQLTINNLHTIAEKLNVSIKELIQEDKAKPVNKKL